MRAWGFWAGLFVAVAAHASLLDQSFNPGTGANGLVETIVPLADGKILMCGNFTTFNNASRAYIARLNANGSIDTNFNGHPAYWVRSMSLQTDGKIVIGGFFNFVEGAPRNLVARLNADGGLDTSFDPGTGATGVLGVAVDGDADPFIFATAIQPDGKILITGNFTNYNGTDMYGIARLNTNGSLDTNFNIGAGFNVNSWGRSLLVQPNGQIMATGWFTSYNNHSYNRMVRLNPDGSADNTFNPSFGDLTAIYNAVLLTNGQYNVVGDSQNTTLFRQNMGRLNPNGSFDTNFAGQDNDKTETIRQQPDGKLLIGGYFSEMDGADRASIARLNPDGTIDAGFSANIDNFVWTIALQSDGRVLIGGGFSKVDGISRNGIARLLASTGPLLQNPHYSGHSFSVATPTVPGANYTLQYRASQSDTNWSTGPSTNGSGSVVTLTDSSATNAARYYRVLMH
ncbi:MAG TPA: delta-60 repeat domain-containing protein [Verrucomicrobiae bacterium]|nr:delta-60 repeat domain-containing protein [Verrucomicrobiae bacterium]